MKPLDPINTKVTWILGVVVLVLGAIGTVLANPIAVGAIVTLFSHPTIPAALAAIGILAGIVAVAVGKPLGTSPAPKE